MSVQERLRMCQIVEKMENQKEYSKRLGLENHSKYRGNKILVKREEIVYEEINKELQ